MTYTNIVYTRESQYEPLEFNVLYTLPSNEIAIRDFNHSFYHYAHKMVDRVRESGETVTSIRRERGWLEIVTGELDEEATYTLNVIHTNDRMDNTIE